MNSGASHLLPCLLFTFIIFSSAAFLSERGGGERDHVKTI